MYISPNYATFTHLGIIDTQLSLIIIYSLHLYVLQSADGQDVSDRHPKGT